MWPGNKQECSYYIEVEGLEVEERAGKRTFSLYITVIGSVLSAGNIKKKKEKRKKYKRSLYVAQNVTSTGQAS